MRRGRQVNTTQEVLGTRWSQSRSDDGGLGLSEVESDSEAT